MTMLEAQEEAEAWAEVERERQEKDAEIARLRVQLGGANAMVEKLREMEADARGEADRLRAALHNQEREFLNAESERTTLRDAVTVYQPQIHALRAALKPFADVARLFPEVPDRHSVLVAMEHFRAALKALGEAG